MAGIKEAAVRLVALNVSAPVTSDESTRMLRFCVAVIAGFHTSSVDCFGNQIISYSFVFV